MEKEAYQELKNLQNTYWWFVAKRKIVVSVVEKYISLFSRKNDFGIKILDAGCGMGILLHELSVFGDVYGMDCEPEAVLYCQENVGKDKVVYGKFPEEVPFEEKTFDVIVSTDCLEHIEDDLGTLREMRKLLKDSNSFVVLTVPALMFLWGYNDDFVHHKRRYEKKQLVKLMGQAGYQVDFCSYYNFWAFPFVWLVRKVKNFMHIKKDDLNRTSKVSNGIMNNMLMRIFVSERHRLVRGGDFRLECL